MTKEFDLHTLESKTLEATPNNKGIVSIDFKKINNIFPLLFGDGFLFEGEFVVSYINKNEVLNRVSLSKDRIGRMIGLATMKGVL